MAILIKGDMLKMPASCHECFASFGGLCFVAPAFSCDDCPDEGRADWCPLVEIPDRHTEDDKMLEDAGFE